jgi:alpha-glucosidase
MERRPGARLDHRLCQATLTVDYGGPVLAVTFVEPGTVRIRLAPTGTFATRRSWCPLAPDDGGSPPAVRLSDDGDTLELASDVLTVRVEGAGGRLAVVDGRDGQVLLDDGPDGGPRWAEPPGPAAWQHRLPPGQHHFGFGERTGPLDKAGRRYRCWCTDRFEEQGPGTDELYVAIPFALVMDDAGRGHGRLLNNSHRSEVDLTDQSGERMVVRVEGGELDHYVFAGPEPAQVLERYTRLAGRMPLPPRWALGYHHARWGYRGAEEMLAVARRLRADRIPTDVLYLDIEHQSGHRTFTWDPDVVPDPARLVGELADAGFRVGSTVGPGVKHEPGAGYALYDEGAERDVFLRDGGADDAGLLLRHVWPGLCAFPDFARPEVRQWWAGWHRVLTDAGVRCVVDDMNEPSMRDRPTDDPAALRVDPPADTRHGPPGERAPHAEVHNVYGTLQATVGADALERAAPGERSLVLSRAGSTGVQRVAAVWTGDNASYWEHLRMSLPQLMNLGLSGVAFAGADIGGFFADCGPELLARWYQLGAFYPLARSNSAKQCAEQEVWSWGPRIEAVCRRALARRYRLLPYLYTVFEESARTGAPVLRPLLYHHGDDRQARLCDDQALVGRDLLIAPVLDPGRDGRSVYLPAGLWYPLAGGPARRGPGRILADAPLDGDAPAYARGGAVIPSGPDLQWTDERPLDPLTVSVHPDGDGRAEGRHYEDDGHTVAYGSAASATTVFTFAHGVLRADRTGGHEPGPRAAEVVVHEATGTVTRHRVDRDGRHWQIGADDEPTHQS